VTTRTAEERSRIGGFQRALAGGVGRIWAGGLDRTMAVEPRADTHQDLDPTETTV
jgi:hypothetical protein